MDAAGARGGLDGLRAGRGRRLARGRRPRTRAHRGPGRDAARWRPARHLRRRCPTACGDEAVSAAAARLRALLAERILVIEGPKGTMIQARGLSEADFRGQRFAAHPRDLRGDNELLILTRPDV